MNDETGQSLGFAPDNDVPIPDMQHTREYRKRGSITSPPVKAPGFLFNQLSSLPLHHALLSYQWSSGRYHDFETLEILIEKALNRCFDKSTVVV